MKMPLATQRILLPLRSVLLECLDAQRQAIPGAFASGFIRREPEGAFLYTCWHVVTGFDPHAVVVGSDLPKRRFLRISLQSTDGSQPCMESIGGLQTITVPLYTSNNLPLEPLWLQDDEHIPHVDLNAVGLYVPFWHDVVKIRLPYNLAISELQTLSDDYLISGADGIVRVGEKCLVVGFPYGFSASGANQPTPVALTRFVAADRVTGRKQELLLESIAAPGMSGAPVFVERDGNLALFGMYTGLIYPDHYRRDRERTTALGTVCSLYFLLWGHLSLVLKPSRQLPL